MKKTYINPIMEVVKIHAPQILAGSDMSAKGDFDSGTINMAGHESDFDFE